MERTEKEILFELAIRCVGDYIDTLKVKEKTVLIYNIAMLIDRQDNPTLKDVFELEQDFKEKSEGN
jgi:hypothetical protein